MTFNRRHCLWLATGAASLWPTLPSAAAPQNAQISQVDPTGFGGTYPVETFPNRQALVTWAATGPQLQAGNLAAASGYVYAFDGVAQVIPDMPGWKPNGATAPDHFSENTVPGTTDMTAAIQAACDYIGHNQTAIVNVDGGGVFLRGMYHVASTVHILASNVALRGEGKTVTQIIGSHPRSSVIEVGKAGAHRVRNFTIQDMAIVAPYGTNKTAGAHLKLTNVTGGGSFNVDYQGFYIGIHSLGSAHWILDNAWFRGRGRNTRAKHCILLDREPESGRHGTGIYITNVDGVGNNNQRLGWVEDFIRIRAGDGVYVNNFHSNSAEYAITVEAHDSAYIADFRMSDFYLDQSFRGNMRVIGNSTRRIRSILMSNGLMRAAGGEGAHIGDTQACSLLLATGSDGLEHLDIHAVHFTTPQGCAIRDITSTIKNLTIRDCTFDRVNQNGTPGLSEITLGGPGISLMGNVFTGGHAASAANITIRPGAQNALVGLNRTSQSAVTTHLDDRGQHTRHALDSLSETTDQGDWVKYADGRLVVTRTLHLPAQKIAIAHGPLFRSANLLSGAADLVAAFSDTPNFQISVRVDGLAAMTAWSGSGSATRFPDTLYAVTVEQADARKITVDLRAEGRWFPEHH